MFDGSQEVVYLKGGRLLHTRFDEVIDEGDIQLIDDDIVGNMHSYRPSAKLIKCKNLDPYLVEIKIGYDDTIITSLDHIHYTWHNGLKYTHELGFTDTFYRLEDLDNYSIKSTKYCSGTEYVYNFEKTEPNVFPYFELANTYIACDNTVLKPNIKLTYDKDYDILYISVGEPAVSEAEPTKVSGVYVWYSAINRRITGVMIENYSEQDLDSILKSWMLPVYLNTKLREFRKINFEYNKGS